MTRVDLPDGLYVVTLAWSSASFEVSGGRLVRCAPLLRRNFARWVRQAKRVPDATRAEVRLAASPKSVNLGTSAGDSGPFAPSATRLPATMGAVARVAGAPAVTGPPPGRPVRGNDASVP